MRWEKKHKSRRPPRFFLFVCFFNAVLHLFFFINLLIYFWLCWVFVSVQGLSLVVASGGHSSLRCAGLSLSRPLLLQSTGSRHVGSVVVAHGPSCSAACEIFPDQGSNPCPLPWQADSQPRRHQGSPPPRFFVLNNCKNRIVINWDDDGCKRNRFGEKIRKSNLDVLSMKCLFATQVVMSSR